MSEVRIKSSQVAGTWQSLPAEAKAVPSLSAWRCLGIAVLFHQKVIETKLYRQIISEFLKYVISIPFLMVNSNYLWVPPHISSCAWNNPNTWGQRQYTCQSCPGFLSARKWQCITGHSNIPSYLSYKTARKTSSPLKRPFFNFMVLALVLHFWKSFS